MALAMRQHQRHSSRVNDIHQQSADTSPLVGRINENISNYIYRRGLQCRNSLAQQGHENLALAEQCADSFRGKLRSTLAMISGEQSCEFVPRRAAITTRLIAAESSRVAERI